MTPNQATKLISMLTSASTPMTAADGRFELFTRHLCALPFDYCLDHARVAITTQPWCNTLPEILTAVGVAESARPALAHAVRAGGRLVRDLRSSTGWTAIDRDAPLPVGALQAASVAKESDSHPNAAAALPPPSTQTKRFDIHVAIKEMLAKQAAKHPPNPSRNVQAATMPSVTPGTAPAEAAPEDRTEIARLRRELAETKAKSDAAIKRADQAYEVYTELCATVDAEERERRREYADHREMKATRQVRLPDEPDFPDARQGW